MTKKLIAEVIVPVSMSLDEPFDYLVPEELAGAIAPGSSVVVPFRNKVYRGYVSRLKKTSPYEDRLKAVRKVLDLPAVDDPDLMNLAAMIREEYFCSLADALKTVLPQGLKSLSKIPRGEAQPSDPIGRAAPVLDDRDEQELKEVEPGARLLLVHDLSGERRWALYAALIKKTLLERKSVLLLVPDHHKIAPALEKCGLSREATILSSIQKLKENLNAWISIKKEKYSFVAGTRSAVFAPVKNLGLAIIEEEEHFAYNQEQVPHYRAHEIALYRGGRADALTVFGSITPSLETARDVTSRGGRIITFKRAQTWPTVHLVDPDQVSAFQGKRRVIARAVEYRLAAALDKKEKILIFVSQKGFAGILYCRHCKKTLVCPRCSIPVKLHKKESFVECPVCHARTREFDICPECKSSYVKFVGFGAEKISAEIQQLFPQGACDIMIVSQGFLETPDYQDRSFGLVYVPDADTMLSHTDFRTTEKAFEKFIKLAALSSKDVYIQTRFRDHYVFKYLRECDPAGFWDREEAERREPGWPPCSRMGELMVRSPKEKTALAAAQECFKKCGRAARSKKSGEVLGPAQAVPFKARGNFRYTLLLRSSDKAVFQKAIRDCIKQNRGSAIITYNPRVA